MTIRIFDRCDDDIPFTSDIYIINTHYAYTVIRNIYGVTFSKEFNNKKDALEYYLKSNFKEVFYNESK